MRVYDFIVNLYNDAYVSKKNVQQQNAVTLRMILKSKEIRFVYKTNTTDYNLLYK